MIHKPPTLRDALQYLALRRERDRRRARLVIKRQQWRAWACGVYGAAVRAIRQLKVR